jgi:hypothetical protein
MSLLMGNLYQRHPVAFCQHFRMGVSNHEARHIATINRSGAGADANSCNPLPCCMGKQPARKLRQAFYVGKYGIALTQAKFSLTYRKQLGTIYTVTTIKVGNGCGVIAGINAYHAH